jgi:hypothetical protein
VTTDWPAVGTLASAILGGGLSMAWRLGSLSGRIKDLEPRLDKIDRTIESHAKAISRLEGIQTGKRMALDEMAQGQK